LKLSAPDLLAFPVPFAVFEHPVGSALVAGLLIEIFHPFQEFPEFDKVAFPDLGSRQVSVMDIIPDGSDGLPDNFSGFGQIQEPFGIERRQGRGLLSIIRQDINS